MAVPGATVSDRSNLAQSRGHGQGIQLGISASDKVAFYGVTPVVQRAYSSAVHATSALATSSDFGATQLAALQEVQKALIGLGIYATA
jgi:hypothetical protein